eukprot:CAMPEP_0169428946 /NCGR_PEP_ID=MMETSP1042-20121227/1598_1 /TAXON_ID=464988 /ORGANISM="Hemiselmis andersenii, Strain CCMP1180" /LENGTH=96 /DNA_ID=CAMNT_0009539151 /DNA_START=419 /DNA_END=706 /DNA_ORIENTATION=-
MSPLSKNTTSSLAPVYQDKPSSRVTAAVTAAEGSLPFLKPSPALYLQNSLGRVARQLSHPKRIRWEIVPEPALAFSTENFREKPSIDNSSPELAVV